MSKPRSKVKLRDEEWVFELKMTLAEAFALKSATGMTPDGFLRGLIDKDPDSIVALLWLCRTRDGEKIRLEQIPTDFDLYDEDEFSMEDLPDPTEGDATPSENDATA